jgi:large subunit ribosomal protein L24
VAASNRAGSGQRPERARTRLRKGDTVLVTAGKDRGKTGKVLKMIAEKNRATVERLNMIKRHTRSQGGAGGGGIVEKEASLHLSNLRLVCSRCNKPTRVRMRVLADGKRVRACHRCDEQVDG